MKKWLLAPLGVFLCLDVWATDRWCSATGAGDNSGSSAANACVFSTANVSTAFGGTLNRGDNLYICGTLGTSNTWGPAGIFGSSGYFTVSGDPAVTGCSQGGWDFGGNTAVPVNIGGGGRNFIKLSGLFFRNCGSHCITWGGNDNWIDQVNFNNAEDNHIRVTVAAQRLLVTRSTFIDWGNNASSAEAAINIEPADGVTVATVTVGGSAANGNLFNGNGVGRYGVSCYPAGTLHNGVASGCEVSYNTFVGSYAVGAVNISRDADNSITRFNDMSGIVSGGGAVIHIGGQQTYGACPSTTDNALIQGNIVTGGSVNAQNPADGDGILPDECAVNVRVLSNVMYGNAVAGLFLNDADNVTAIGNVIYGNGDNAIHVHGLGINFVAYNNSIYHNATASGVADQGIDGVQIDATAGSGTILRNNSIVCGPNTPKCVDADTTISESYNNIRTEGTTRAEGFTPDATDKNVDPEFIGPMNNFRNFQLTAGSPLRRAGIDLNIGNYPDVSGKAFSHPPSIGGWEETFSIARTTSNPRTTRQ